MSVTFMTPAEANAGTTISVMAMGLTAPPKDADLSILIDERPATGQAVWESRTQKLTISVPTKAGQTFVDIAVQTNPTTCASVSLVLI